MDKIQLRRGTAAEWTAADPVLAAGELGWESDTKKAKVGDGTTLWSALDYAIEPVIFTLDELSDVDLTTAVPTDGQVLTFDTATSQWVPETPSSGGATSLDGLSDVDTATTAPVTGDVLVFNGTSWVPDAPSAGDTSAVDMLTWLANNRDNRFNQAVNPSFDKGAVTPWVPSVNATALAVAATAGIGKIGPNFFSWSTNGTGEVYYGMFPGLTAGDVRAWSLYAGASIAGYTGRIRLRYFDNADNLIGGGYVEGTYSTLTTGKADARVSMVHTVPAGATKVQVFFEVTGTGAATIYVDGLLFEKAPYVLPYIAPPEVQVFTPELGLHQGATLASNYGLVGWSLNATGTQGVIATLDVPAGWNTMNVEAIYYTQSGAGGDIKWSLSVDFYSKVAVDSKSIVAGRTVVASPTIANPATVSGYHPKTVTIASGVALTAERIMGVVLERLGGDAADTYGNPAVIIGLRLTRAS